MGKSPKRAAVKHESMLDRTGQSILGAGKSGDGRFKIKLCGTECYEESNHPIIF